MDLKHVTYECADRIATITVNRPDKLNALNDAVMADIDAAFTHGHENADDAGTATRKPDSKLRIVEHLAQVAHQAD